MTEAQAAVLLEQGAMVIKLLTAVVCGLGFIAAGQFWAMVRRMMQERDF